MRLPKPGTELGPCDERATCRHLDCLTMVAQATALCHTCGNELGYDTDFYADTKDGSYGEQVGVLMHDGCGSGEELT